MKSTSKSKRTFFWRVVLCCVFLIALLGIASASENGANVYPVGVETVMTGFSPRPGETRFYEYTAFVNANETDSSDGQKVPTEFKLRVFATAYKFSHTWDQKILGGYLHSFVAVPLVFQDLHVAPGNFSKYAIANVSVVPLGLGWNKGIAHFYTEPTQFFTPGTAYSKSDVLNVGQHNLAWAPDFSITLLPNKGKQEIGSHLTYVVNGYDKDTNYHSGNQFSWEFNADQEITKKVAVGINGFFEKQTTDDHQFGELVNGNGNRGRDLGIGPQVRINYHGGGCAFKYYRDTLTQNQARGNAFWFQFTVPVKFGVGKEKL